jgi:hypothetical protein
LAPQSLVLLGGELEHEILWKPINVALSGAVEGLRLDAVESGEIGIQQDTLAAKGDDEGSGVWQGGMGGFA